MVTVLGRGTVLLVDSRPERSAELGAGISSYGYNVIYESSARAGLRRVRARSVNVVMVSADIPDMHMSTFLESLGRANLAAGVVIYGRTASAEEAVNWMRAGAVDVIIEPSDSQRVREAVALAFSRSARFSSESAAVEAGQPPEQGMLYRTKVMDDLMTKARRVAPVKATVLITGESGTGKEVLARQIHLMSGRRGLYLALNCAAIPETLLEDELFGHERGAFTGADRMRQGRFEAAEGGTLMLDEIGDIPQATQVKLLRSLEEEKVTRLGGNNPLPTDVRLIAATNSDLQSRVREGRFRQDLYYRLKVVELEIPPLRARRQDIPLLTMAFLRQGSERLGLRAPMLEPAALQKLTAFSWPGNVRQLKNTVESLLITSGEKITEADLPREISGGSPGSTTTLQIDLPATLEEVEDKLIEQTLAITGGNRTLAASLLGVGRRTLQRKLGGNG